MKKVLLTLFTTILLLAVFPAKAFAKDYWIKSADFKVDLNPDGSAIVTETRSYAFKGSYSWADEWINLKAKCVKKAESCENYKISGFEIWEGDKKFSQADSAFPYTYQLTISPDKLYIKWFYSVLNQDKIFTLRYRIVNAITNSKDISEFYWQLIGGEWQKGSREVTAQVFLPGQAPSDKIWAFGHGPLNGQIKIVSDREVDFSAQNLPSRKFFEVRVLFPKAETYINARQSSQTLQEILEEEKGFATKTRTLSFLPFLLLLLFGTFSIYKSSYWIYKWFKIGRDEPLPEVNLAGKLHEPPSDLPPVLVETLNNWNLCPTGKSLVASILELARRKIVGVGREKRVQKLGILGKSEEYYLVLKNEDILSVKSKEASPLEKRLLDFIFSSGNKVSFDQIKKFGTTKPSSTMEFWKWWRENPKEELVARGFLERESFEAEKKLDRDIILTVIFTVIYAFSFPFWGILGGIWSIAGFISLFPLNFFAIIILAVLKPLINKRTSKGNKELAGWRAFRSWLKDYSVTKNYPIDSVILWEKYLVYGSALGISLKALSQLPIKYSEAYASSGLYLAGATNAQTSFAGLGASLSSLSSSVSSYGAHGVGSSGGFSGGGGGGGGGGGEGAG